MEIAKKRKKGLQASTRERSEHEQEQLRASGSEIFWVATSLDVQILPSTGKHGYMLASEEARSLIYEGA